MRTFTIATAATTALLLGACAGGGGDPTPPTPPTDLPTTEAPTTEAPTTPEPAEPTEDPTPEPTTEPAEPTQAPTTEAPTTQPAATEDPDAHPTWDLYPGDDPIATEDFPTAGGDLYLAEAEVVMRDVGRQASFHFEGEDRLVWEARFVDTALAQGSGMEINMGDSEYILQITLSHLRYPEMDEEVITEVDTSDLEDPVVVRVDPPFEGMSVIYIGVQDVEFATIEVVEEAGGTVLNVLL